MPSVNIEDNIKTMRSKLMDLQNQLFKIQGGLEVFEGFKEAGLTIIDIPNDPTQEPIEELESIQEKPE